MEVERIKREMEDKPYKCQHIIKWMKLKGGEKLLQEGVRDKTTLIIQAN